MLKDIALESVVERNDPFPYIEVGQFFKDDFFHELKRALPDESEYQDCSGDNKRKEFWISNNDSMSFPKKEFADILKYTEDLFNGALADQIFSILQNTINSDRELFKLWQKGRPRAQLRLVKEWCPYTLAPHLDMEQKICVLIIYLDAEGDFGSNGTTVYKKNGDQFEAVATTSFKLNASLILPRTKNSWHGGQWFGSGERNTLHVYYFAGA